MIYTYLSFEEREVIYNSKVFRLYIYQIASKLKRHPSSLYKEIKRNQNKLGGYTTNEAQRKYHKRRQN